MSVISCPSCNTPVPPGAIFCDNCGYDLRTVSSSAAQAAAPTKLASSSDADGLVCTTCQHKNIAGSAFCENCGAPLSPAQAPPPQSPPYTPSPGQPTPAEGLPPLSPIPAEPQPGVPQPSPAPPVTVTGRLVFQDSSPPIKIPEGKQTVVMGREDPVSGVFPDIDLDPYGGHEAGVGRQHAQLIIQGGKLHIEDLESVNGTVVNKQRIQPRRPHPLNHGDEVRLGKLVMIYYTN